MAGVILLGTMLVCGIFLYAKRRRQQNQTSGDLVQYDDHNTNRSTELMDSDASCDCNDADVIACDDDTDTDGKTSGYNYTNK